ncbi:MULTISPECIES: flagellar protein export ATPase FliI [Dehalobacter]|jgi:flagellum-specific ATP synthase|uniref:Flagellar protein export ATPase FliI n=2 Tax=Dehalobacter restrictus TaxID=55583 RepID=A0A857DIT3_9FIRM|nr:MULTISPECIES: flagellar protein export ATPase FliI [Dehalobacter]AHF10617.1 ATP synthase [Dehalobacter restrictus DSM 9455]MCG1026414.1 flagellar protein export ATPase FliI [Dehalobacter sp.]MDJ0306001.1 flagellar protein export ATPase FliI [Dehalobacter sp.]OCZ52348.1 flagellar protein export ATPase FliI [Dehalobacter sp. TeCB1]QHA01240.1 flagellar protein export ATPase FliI [Dehalobacter restrictus]
MADWKTLARKIEQYEPISAWGLVSKISGLLVEADGPRVSVGKYCHIMASGSKAIPAEVVGFRGTKTLFMPLGELEGVAPGDKVVPQDETLNVKVGPGLLGRILDGLGQPLDGRSLNTDQAYPLHNRPPSALLRPRIREPLNVGVRVIDGLLTMGRGQRMGIFAGSGVGKSTLLGMMARNSEADVNVIALVGERGRELRDFMEKDLGEEGLSRSVIIVATSDQPALVRLKAAFTATAVAEYFRDKGKNVLFMMDSVTRFAMAQREIGLTVGEPPATRGYPPSVFAMLPKLLERVGLSEKGSITGIYTVLVDGDDHNEPIADAVRGILDGHIVLTRELASKNHYPSIDVLQSISRLMNDVADPRVQELAGKIREHLAVYREAKDLIDIGAYVAGSSSRIDQAIKYDEKIRAFVCQNTNGKCSFAEMLSFMQNVFEEDGT